MHGHTLGFHPQTHEITLQNKKTAPQDFPVTFEWSQLTPQTQKLESPHAVKLKLQQEALFEHPKNQNITVNRTSTKRPPHFRRVLRYFFLLLPLLHVSGQ